MKTPCARLVASLALGLVLASCSSGIPREEALREDRPLVRVPGMREGGDVYFLPLGSSNESAVRDLAGYFEEHLGLWSAVLPPMEVPASVIDPKRRQIVGEALLAEIVARYPDRRDDVIVAVTGDDLYSREAGFNFVFSVRDWTETGALAALSTARMDPRFFRRAADPELTRARLRKMATKNVGMLHYGLEPNKDPESVLFSPIGGLEDLDRMGFGF